MSELQGLIGGIGLTEVRVYAQHRAPDGQFSGCPHVHAVTSEAYFVLEGHGYVEFHDLENGFRTLKLEPGQYVQFPPMVMHRLVSDGTLLILGMMGNAGLAERGEARIYFGKEIDEDDSKFALIVSLAKERGLEGALQRRDRAVQGYLELINLWNVDQPAYFAELKRFFERHARAMAMRSEELLNPIQQGPLGWAGETIRRLESLPGMDGASTEVEVSRRGEEQAFGMCGVLRPILKLNRV